ncbi:MAG: chromosome segregation ATPase [Pseudohongiellaceae bacterium]
MEQFREVVNFDGGKLEERYNRLNDSYQDSVTAADNITNRIGKVDSVANALFDEWEDEIDEYSNQKFKRLSQQQLRDTKTRYSRLLHAMRKAESSIEPVLVTLKDNTLFLKHNLNARAISSLKGELSNVNQQVSSLISNMEKAIQESDSFIKELQSS